MMPPDAWATSYGLCTGPLRPSPAEPLRGIPLAERSSTFADRLVELATEIDVVATRRCGTERAMPHRGRPSTWLHGDLHPANTLVSHGTLVGILDFGDICTGTRQPTSQRR